MSGLNSVTSAFSGFSIDDFSALDLLVLCFVTFCIYDFIFALYRFLVSFFKKKGGK